MTYMVDKILPCKVCGPFEYNYLHLISTEINLFWVVCAECHTDTEIFDHAYQAINEWNKMQREP